MAPVNSDNPATPSTQETTSPMEGQTTSNPVLLPYPNFTTPTRANSKSIAVKNAAGETVTLAGSTELAVPSAATQPQPFIVKFYDPTTAAKDSQGRSLSSMLQWDDDKLEFKHDYIQIWFPLPEGSPFNWDAPVIDRATFTAFRSSPDLRANLLRAFVRILLFYGFDTAIQGGDASITASANYQNAFRNWVCRTDHNHLRITRIIRSLRVLGLEQSSQAFYEALLQVNSDFPNRIGARSLMYWKRAATRPLYLAPDVDNDDAVVGPKFLQDFEEERALHNDS